MSLKKGEPVTIVVRKKDGLTFSNSGGEIKLVRPDASTAQVVRYDEADAKIQGAVLVWDGEHDLLVFKE